MSDGAPKNAPAAKRRKSGGDTAWNVVGTITLEEHRRRDDEPVHFVQSERFVGGVE